MSELTKIIKASSDIGKTPAIVLIDPKFSHNVGAAIRAASCFGIEQVWMTGHRIEDDLEGRKRLPREERMKGYGEVELFWYDYPFDVFENAVPVCVEIMESAENLASFRHPRNAIYVFGPEDGGVGSTIKRHCHRFVTIPARHCLNLAAAINVVLYDRAVWFWNEYGEQLPELVEERG